MAATETYQETATRERREKHQAADAAARAICAALGDGWTLEGPDASDYDPRVTFHGPAGEMVHMDNYGGSNGRWHLSGTLPQGLYNHKRYNDQTGDITVSASKTGAQIARDIERRLLPQYRATLNTARERFAAWQQDQRELTDITDRLIVALGGHGEAREIRNGNTTEAAGHLAMSYRSPFHGEMSVSYARDGGRTVRIKADYLTLAEAEAVCRILAARPLRPERE